MKDVRHFENLQTTTFNIRQPNECEENITFISDNNKEDVKRITTMSEEEFIGPVQKIMSNEKGKGTKQEQEQQEETTLSTEQKIMLTNCEVTWPKVTYSKHAKRIREDVDDGCVNKTFRTLDGRSVYYKNTDRIDETFAKILSNWSEYPEISIDGMNGLGKSTLIESMKRQYIKVNMIDPSITNGPNYNYDTMVSLQYIVLSSLAKAKNACWDRCPYANLIFYYVHHLMSIYKDKMIPLDDQDAVFQHFNNLSVQIQLTTILGFFNTYKCIPTLFFICSDLEYIVLSMVDRGNINDVYNAKEYNYQISQYYAYVYFSKLLPQCVLIDVADYFKLGYTLSEFQQTIISLVDIKGKDGDGGGEKIEYELTVPSLQASTKVNQILNRIGNDDTLVYNYTKK
jgi:hypothetical protein